MSGPAGRGSSADAGAAARAGDADPAARLADAGPADAAPADAGSGAAAPAIVEVRTGDWAAMRAEAAPIRLEVFVVEQGCPESEEWDAHDAVSVHAVAYVGGAPVATGRLLPDGHVGRMAVRAAHRRGGVGARVLLRLVELARARGDAAVVLSSQCHARGFYARHGFVAYGGVFDDCGIPHQMMRRALR